MCEGRSLGEVMGKVAARHVDVGVVEAALRAVGGAVRRPLEDLPAHQRTRLINQFVRALRGPSVHAALRIEKELLDQADCAPAPHCELMARDGLSTIALRSHVRYIAVYAGLDWNDGMMLQSAFSELARVLQADGGAVFRFEATDDFSEVAVEVAAASAPSSQVRELIDTWKQSLPPCLRCVSDVRQALVLRLVPRATAA